MDKLEVDCALAHCRCMQMSPCRNHHYKDCQPNWGQEPDLPEIGQKELGFAARIFCIALIDTNAEEMTMTQEGFYGKGKDYGDFEIIVKRIKK